MFVAVGCVDGANAPVQTTIIYATPTPTPTAEPTPSYSPDKAKFREELSALNLSVTPKKLVWVGDSITEQGKTGVGNSIGFPTYIQNIYPNITYFNEGVGGNTTKDILNRIASIKAHAADYYVVAVGINDARYNDSRGATSTEAYINNISQIVSALKENDAQVALVSIFPSFWKDQYSALLRFSTDARFEQWNTALKNYAQTNGLLYLDAYSKIRNEIDLVNVNSLIPDGVHPDYTGTTGKLLYADSVLYDELPHSYSTPYFPYGTYYYKLVIKDNNNPDRLVGIRCIESDSTILDIFGPTANLSYSGIAPALLGYNPAFVGFYNKSSDFPQNITLSSAVPLQKLVFTGMLKTNSSVNRGVRSYDLYTSQNAEALTNLLHPSWKLFRQEPSNDGIAINLIPSRRLGVYYRLTMSSSNDASGLVSLKRIAHQGLPVRVWTQNVTATSAQYFSALFSTAGTSTLTQALVGQTRNYVVSWEAEEDQHSIEIESYNGSLKDWTLHRSYSSTALKNTADSSWALVASGSGDATVSLP